MSMLLIFFGFLFCLQNAFGKNFVNVCSRSPEVAEAISKAANKSCQDITQADLESIAALEIKGSPYGNGCDLSVKANDFGDLNQMRTLVFNYTYQNRNCSEGQLPSQLFKGLKNLENLSLATVPITVLSPNLFDELLNLKHLNLASFNELKLNDLPSEIFKNQTQLESLDLSGQPYVVLSENLSYSLASLLELEVDLALMFRTESFPRPIFKSLKNLKSLKLVNLMQSSNFSQIPADFFEGLENLRELYIYNLLGLSIESRFFLPLVKLEKLQIRNSSGLLVPVELASKPFINLRNLKELDIQNIGLAEIQDDLFEGLDELRSLDLSRNPIKKLPDTFFQDSSKIENIYMSFCGITQLPQIFISNFYARPWVTNLSLNWGNPLNVSTKSNLRSLRNKETKSIISYDDPI